MALRNELILLRGVSVLVNFTRLEVRLRRYQMLRSGRIWMYLGFSTIPLLWAPILVAQTTNASIVGLVNDPSAAAIPGSTVVVTNTGTGVSRTVTTNEAGLYNVAPLIPGTYEVKVTAQGFKTQVQPNIVLQTGAVVKVDFNMEVGAVTESVEVAATAALLQTQEASVAGVVTTSQLERI